MLFTKATREKAKLRMALTGVSGAGKTLSALYIAYGLTEDWSKIALIDTEHSRAKFYANRTDLHTGSFLHAAMEPPFTPDKYKQYMNTPHLQFVNGLNHICCQNMILTYKML